MVSRPSPSSGSRRRRRRSGGVLPRRSSDWPYRRGGGSMTHFPTPKVSGDRALARSAALLRNHDAGVRGACHPRADGAGVTEREIAQVPVKNHANGAQSAGPFARRHERSCSRMGPSRCGSSTAVRFRRRGRGRADGGRAPCVAGVGRGRTRSGTASRASGPPRRPRARRSMAGFAPARRPRRTTRAARSSSSRSRTSGSPREGRAGHARRRPRSRAACRSTAGGLGARSSARRARARAEVVVWWQLTWCVPWRQVRCNVALAQSSAAQAPTTGSRS
jgi:hypothetical protein